MKKILLILIVIFFFIGLRGQEQLSDIKSDKDATYQLLIQNDDEPSILSIGPDGNYSINAFSNTGIAKTILKGTTKFQITNWGNIYYHSNHIIYSTNKAVFIHNVLNEETYQVKCPDAYAFGRVNSSLIDSNSLIVKLVETTWDITAKQYLIDFQGNVRVINEKDNFTRRFGNYLITAFNDDDFEYKLYSINDDVTTSLDSNYSNTFSFMMMEGGVYRILDNNLYVLDYKTKQNKHLLDLPIDTLGYVRFTMDNGDLVIENKFGKNNQFFIIDLDKNEVKYDKIFRGDYYLNYRGVNNEFAFFATLNQDTFPVIEEFLIVNMNTGIEVVLNCECDFLPNTLHIIDSLVLYYGTNGLTNINVKKGKVELLKVDDQFRYIYNAIKLDGTRVLLTLDPTDFELNISAVIFNITDGKFTEFNKSKNYDLGLNKNAQLHHHGKLLFVTDNDDVYYYHNDLVKLNLNGFVFKENSLKYIDAIKKSYLVLQNGLTQKLIQVDENGVKDVVDLPSLVNYRDYFYFQDQLVFFDNINLFVFDFTSGSFKVYDNTFFSYKVHDNILYGWRSGLLSIFEDMSEEPSKHSFSSNISDVVVFKDEVFINAKRLYKYNDGEIYEIPIQGSIGDSDYTHGITVLDNYLVTTIVKSFNPYLGVYKEDSLVLNETQKIYSDRISKGDLLMSSLDDMGKLFDANKNFTYNLSDFYSYSSFKDIIYHSNDTLIITEDKGSRNQIQISKFADDFSTKQSRYVIRDELESSKIWVEDYLDNKLIKTGSHIYLYGDSVQSIATNLIAKYESAPVIIDDYVYYIGWEPSNGGQLYRINLDKQHPGNNPNQQDSIAFYLYPNPSGTQIRIKNDQYFNEVISFKIYDALGRVVKIKSEHNLNETITISEMVEGYYLLRFKLNGNQMVFPFIKSNDY